MSRSLYLMYHKGKLYPYEFKRYACATPRAAFVEEYGCSLERHGLIDLLGFQIYTDGIVGLESTDTDTRVSTTVDLPETEPMPEDMPHASWAFFRPTSITVQGRPPLSSSSTEVWRDFHNREEVGFVVRSRIWMLRPYSQVCS